MFTARRVLVMGILIALLVAACAPAFTASLGPWQGGSVAQEATPASPFALTDPASGSHSLALLQSTIIPPRDRIDLARRLLGLVDVPAPPTEPPPELALGDVITFWADNLDQDYAFQVEAELVHKTDHVYMFVEVGETVNATAIQRSAEALETVIRPKIHEVFGTEWLPGIDGDPHLYVLHAANLGDWVAAYYGSTSQYPVEAVANSNEYEMFYVNLDSMRLAIGTPYYEGVLAHEFQHMVHWAVDQNEDTWLNEGLSELATLLTRYGVSNWVHPFLAAPAIQLNHWPEDNSARGLHYGSSFLFLAYFYQRYGEAATTTLVRDQANGLVSVEKTLATIGATDPATGQPVTLEDLFADWLVTNLLQDPAAGDGRFAYTLPEMPRLPKAAVTAQIQPDGTLREFNAPQWGPNYLRVRGGDAPQRIRLSFTGQETVQIVPVDAHSGRFMWWSNRADDSDTRLTRTFDLAGVDRATLSYWAWYWIEALWDYAYVMVSVDGGATWTPLETTRTTTDDPHGNAYGPGYTGSSGAWVQETVDLTPYAGQVVQIRFEYITDDAVTQPGMIVDDVAIPEIGYADDFESGDGGWISEGWMRTDNRLPQDFLVMVVNDGPAARAHPVTRLVSAGDAPSGEWDIVAGGDYGDAVIVVAGLAPVTTEAAEYTVLLTPAG